MVIEPSLCRATAVLLLAPAGERHQGYGLAMRLSPNVSRGVVAVHFWQPDIKNNNVRFKRCNGLDCFDSIIGRLHIVPHHSKHHGQAIRSVFEVINYNNPTSGYW